MTSTPYPQFRDEAVTADEYWGLDPILGVDPDGTDYPDIKPEHYDTVEAWALDSGYVRSLAVESGWANEHGPADILECYYFAQEAARMFDEPREEYKTNYERFLELFDELPFWKRFVLVCVPAIGLMITLLIIELLTR